MVISLGLRGWCGVEVLALSLLSVLRLSLLAPPRGSRSTAVLASSLALQMPWTWLLVRHLTVDKGYVGFDDNIGIL